MVQWLFDQFAGCIVPFDAVQLAAERGRVDILQLFKHNEVPPRKDGGLRLRDEIQADKGNVIRWGHHVIARAAAAGQHKTIWWLYKNTKAPRWMTSVLMIAMYQGDLVLLEWLKDRYRTRGPEPTSNLQMAKHLHERYWYKIRTSRYHPITKSFGHFESAPLWVLSKAMVSALQSGKLEFVKWLYETFGSDIDLFDVTNWPEWERSSLGLDTAVRGGNLTLVKYLHEISAISAPTAGRKQAKRAKTVRRGRLMCTTAAMDQAAAGGHLDVVKWLHSNRTEGCTTAAMDGKWAPRGAGVACITSVGRLYGCSNEYRRESWAARNRQVAERAYVSRVFNRSNGWRCGSGHLEGVKWLHLYCWEGCTAAAMNGAAKNGHLEVIEWLHKHSSVGCTTKATDDAAINGHLNIVKWLHQNRTEGCTTAAMDEAARNGKLDIVKWLHNHRSEGCTTKAMNKAKTLGIVQWLQTNRSEGCSVLAWEDAAADGDFDRLLYLHSQRFEGFSEDEIDEIRKYDIFEDMHEISYDSPTDNIIDWLDENYCEECEDSEDDSDMDSLDDY